MKLFITTLISIFFLAGVVSAQNKGQDEEKEYVQLSDPVEKTDDYLVFGSSFNTEIRSVELNELIAQSREFDNKTVTIEGTIKQVCQKKGCFFVLESDKELARISFKDYSFFIPTNTAGSRVKLNGTFSVRTISEKDAKHLAEDAGEDPDAISGPQKEHAVVATSVVIYK